MITQHRDVLLEQSEYNICSTQRKCVINVYCQLEESEGWNSDKFKEEAGQTFNLVFHKYNHRVRPPLPFIEIITTISLRHIRHLDLHKQELQTVLDVEMNWTDIRLQWYPVKVHQISVNTSYIWTPDIVYTNSVAETKSLYPSSARINNKGLVVWTKKEVVTTLCESQPDRRPHVCPISFGFMSNNRLDQTDRFFSNLSSFSHAADFYNHEWNVQDIELDLDIGNLTGRASTMELYIYLERRTKDTEVLPLEHNNEANLPSSHCSGAEELKNKENNHASRVETNMTFLGFMLVITSTVHVNCLISLLR